MRESNENTFYLTSYAPKYINLKYHKYLHRKVFKRISFDNQQIDTSTKRK